MFIPRFCFENYLEPTKTSRERNNGSVILKVALLYAPKEHLLLMRLLSCEKIDHRKEQILVNNTPTLEIFTASQWL
jgi:hypothetical protein